MKDNTAKVISLHPNMMDATATHGGPLLRCGPIRHSLTVLGGVSNIIRFGGMIAEFAMLSAAIVFGHPGDTFVCIMTCLAVACGLGGLAASTMLDAVFAAIMGVTADQSIESLLGSAVFHASTMDDLREMLPGDVFDAFAKHSLDPRAKACKHGLRFQSIVDHSLEKVNSKTFDCPLFFSSIPG